MKSCEENGRRVWPGVELQRMLSVASFPRNLGETSLLRHEENCLKLKLMPLCMVANGYKNCYCQETVSYILCV